MNIKQNTLRKTDIGECVGSMEGGWQQGEAVGGGSEGADAASCFPGSELQVRSRADVAQEDATAGAGDNGGLMGSEWQQGGVVRSGSIGGAGVACSFLEPELQIEPQAGVSQSAVGAQQLCGSARIDRLRNGGRKVKARERSEKVGDGSAGVAETAQAKHDRLRAQVEAALDRMKEAEQRVAPRLAAERNRRLEARWKGQEARGKAARARRRAEQDQGSKARPAQAGPGPCAACARQGSICGLCRERKRLAC